MSSIIEKIDRTHKMHHFYLLILLSPILMFFVHGLLTGFAFEAVDMMFAAALGRSILAIGLAEIVLVFGKPSSAWITAICAVVISAFVIHHATPSG